MKYLYCLLGIPQILCFLLFRNKKQEIKNDLFRFSKGSNIKCFIQQLANKEYRNVFYLRLPFILRQLLNLILPRERTLYLHTEKIGGGLVVRHGFSTIVVAEKIGRNFYVHQNVTVGWDKNGKPTIGDNVSIYTGAVVVGKIIIGNNVRIAANTVVRHDIPNDCLVYGNPCIVKEL